jgi:hypothetical protein
VPFERLSPCDFERPCLWLGGREMYERAERLGAAGGEQGRDIVAWREGARWVFQCKRVGHFGPRDAQAEVEKALALPEAERPAVIDRAYREEEWVVEIDERVGAPAWSRTAVPWSGCGGRWGGESLKTLRGVSSLKGFR